MAKQKKMQVEAGQRKKTGRHAISKTSVNKRSKNYKKPYKGQGRCR